MNKHVCRKCGSDKLYIEENGTQCGLYCKSCGAWQKWLGKNEKRVVEQEIVEPAEPAGDNNDTLITTLQARCVALSEELKRQREELERWHTDKWNDQIENECAATSAYCCHNCDHKDEYIIELETEKKLFQQISCHSLPYDGGVKFGVDGIPGQMFLAVLVSFFEQNGGKNYITITVNNDKAHYDITIRNCDGTLTPAEKIVQLEAGLKAAVGDMAAMVDRLPAGLGCYWCVHRKPDGGRDDICEKADKCVWQYHSPAEREEQK